MPHHARSTASAFGVEYTGALGSVWTYAHQLSDEIRRHQRGLRGVARSKIAYISDRDSESMPGLEKPLSDSRIVGMLQEEGLILARRTIAKYREELKTPTSSQRKALY